MNLPQKRILVPDNSVMLPAYFPERLSIDGNEIVLSPRAERIVAAIRSGEVLAFAPEILRFEFLEKASGKISGFGGAKRHERQTVQEYIDDFLFSLRIRWIPGEALDYVALDLMRNHQLAPSDAYYLACAIVHQGELWISHDHHDGFTQNARKVHANVFTLVKDKF